MWGFRSVAFETSSVFDWVHGLSSQTPGEETGNLILLLFHCCMRRKAHMHLTLFLFACCRSFFSVMFKTDFTLTILLIQQHAEHAIQAQMLTGASKPIGTQLFKNESVPCVCEYPVPCSCHFLTVEVENWQAVRHWYMFVCVVFWYPLVLLLSDHHWHRHSRPAAGWARADDSWLRCQRVASGTEPEPQLHAGPRGGLARL